MVAFSISGACCGALVASVLSGPYLQAIFGLFLLATAPYMILKKPPHDPDGELPILKQPLVALGGFVIGFVASLIGSGGGILMVPFLHTLKLKMRYAVGTSILVGFPVAVVGALTFLIIGMYSIPSTPYTIGYLHWPALAAITLAGMVGAPLGAALSSRLRSALLQRFFAALMIVVGIKMLLSN
jgi:uncharacterized membrane protein YfcA